MISKKEEEVSAEVKNPTKICKLAKLRKEFGFFGSQGTDRQIEFEAFPSVKVAKEYFTFNKILVCGVEITNNSQSIITHPFKGSTVFLLGNEVIICILFLIMKIREQD